MTTSVVYYSFEEINHGFIFYCDRHLGMNMACSSFFFFKIYLFVYWLGWVFIAALELSLVAVRWELLSSCSAWASH